ncbi:MAG: methyltransferase [Micavibrio aeruginosavorus]|uniref:Methyltransferase n=1 Tax=Micavibrio aeruginosavorus TaxID=349221 RepID=A0A2W5FH46_9BACT|nr:MAG: methyltransferase [Micavibrio aeruginosavorus]
MSNQLHDLIVRQIGLNGPITIANYMDLCLTHPDFGYYRKAYPVGAAGDFITAPEVSQLFGEMVGIWAADIIGKLGNPKKVILCELGPGRGTLMKDVLRVLSKLNLTIDVHLIEISDTLKAEQKQALGDVRWHEGIETLPDDAPIIFIANEFFDALSFRQAVKTKVGWQEAVIGLNGDQLAFGLGSLLRGNDLPDAPENSVYEFSPAREMAWEEITARVEKQKGAALVIDYGHLEPKLVGTFQAVKNHQYANVLENPGEQDLTSHVDFSILKHLTQGVQVDHFTTQSEFLKAMGIEIRAENLSGANPALRENIMAGLRRLIHRDEMGQLFKVIGISKCI